MYFAVKVKSINDVSKEEDYLANIAHKLLHTINFNSNVAQADFDIMIDTTLMLWKKCKETFEKYQTGSHDNYLWVNKLENLSKVKNSQGKTVPLRLILSVLFSSCPKWLYILSVVHDSMCFYNISSIDPAVFAHCSLRLGFVYEAFANIGIKASELFGSYDILVSMKLTLDFVFEPKDINGEYSANMVRIFDSKSK
jgi:hypothetical protein